MKLHLPNPFSCWQPPKHAASPAEGAPPGTNASVGLCAYGAVANNGPAARRALDAPAVGAARDAWESLRSTLARKNATGTRPVKVIAQALAFTQTHCVVAINRDPGVAYALAAFVAAQKTVCPTPRHMTCVDALVAHLRAHCGAIHSLDMEALLTLHGLGLEATEQRTTGAPGTDLLREACAGVPGLFALCVKTAQRLADESGADLDACRSCMQAFASTSLRQDSLREWLRTEQLPQLARSSASLHWLMRLAQRPPLREAALAEQAFGVVQSLLENNVSASLEQLDRFVDRLVETAPAERAGLCAGAARCSAALDGAVGALELVPAIAQLLAGANAAHARALFADAAVIAANLPKDFAQWPARLAATTVTGLAALIRRARCEKHLALAEWQKLLGRGLQASGALAAELAKMPPVLLSSHYQWLHPHLLAASDAAHLRALVAPMQSVLIVDATEQQSQLRTESLLQISRVSYAQTLWLYANGQDSAQLCTHDAERALWESVCTAYAPGAANMGQAVCDLTKTCFQRFGADRMGTAWELMGAVVSTHSVEAGIAVLTKLREGLLATTMIEENVTDWLKTVSSLLWLMRGEHAGNTSEAFAKALTSFGTMLKLDEQSGIPKTLWMGDIHSPRLDLEALHHDLLKPQAGRGVVKKRRELLQTFLTWSWNGPFGPPIADDFMRCAFEQVDAQTRDVLLDMAGHLVQHKRLLADAFDPVIKTLMRAFVADVPPEGHTLTRAQIFEAQARSVVLGLFFHPSSRKHVAENMRAIEGVAAQVPADVRQNPATLRKLDLVMARLRGLVDEEVGLAFAPAQPSKEGVSLRRAIWRAFTRTPPTGCDSVAWRLQQVDAWAKQHPENVKLRAILRQDGYALWDHEVRPQTYRSLIRSARGDEPEYFRNHAQQYKDVLQQLAVKDLAVGRRLIPVSQLFGMEDGMEAMRKQRDAAVVRIRKESEKNPRGNIAPVLDALIRQEPRPTKQAPCSAKNRLLTVGLTRNFWDALELCGPQIPGCYAPDGIHREKPLMMAIREDNRLLVMRDENGREIANIECYMSPHGLVLHPLHSEEARMQTAAVWMTYLRDLLQQGHAPKIIFLKNHPSPALYALAAQAVQPGGAAGTKFSYREVIFKAPYWDVEPEDITALDEHAIVLTRENTAAMRIPEVDSEAQYAALNAVMGAISKTKDMPSGPLLKVLGLPLRNFIRDVLQGHKATLSGLAQTMSAERWEKDLGSDVKERCAYFARLESTVRGHITRLATS